MSTEEIRINRPPILLVVIDDKGEQAQFLILRGIRIRIECHQRIESGDCLTMFTIISD